MKAFERYPRVPTTYDKMLAGIRENVNQQSAIRPLYTWDYVQDCTPRCPAYNGEICHFKKEGTRKCAVMTMFLRGVADTVMMAVPEGEHIDQRALWRIGMHLMPLYQMLGRIKIEEATYTRVIYTDDKGRRKANPIFKELRETLKLIEAVWKSLNMGGLMPSSPELDFGDKEAEGVRDYYKSMQSGQKVKRKVKKNR